MKKILLTLVAVLCITATAMAQTNLMQIPLDSIQHNDTDSCQSIMVRHKEKIKPTQYHYKRSNYMTTGNEDGFKGFRDYIVRKRRREEGRPLQPLPPRMFR